MGCPVAGRRVWRASRRSWQGATTKQQSCTVARRSNTASVVGGRRNRRNVHGHPISEGRAGPPLGPLPTARVHMARRNDALRASRRGLLAACAVVRLSSPSHCAIPGATTGQSPGQSRSRLMYSISPSRPERNENLSQRLVSRRPSRTRRNHHRDPCRDHLPPVRPVVGAC